VWAYSGISEQVGRWESAYHALHPEVRFHNEFHGAAAIMAGLYNGVGDLAFMGREIWPVETMAYQWVYQQQPFGVMVATAGLRAPGQLFTPVILVNSKNPIASITLSQLNAIFGSEHRAAPANIRTWGELGLKGDWADKPIHPYGFSGEDPLGVFFRHDVLRADFKPNPDTMIVSDHDKTSTPAATRIQQSVATDPYAIGYTLAPETAGTRVLPVGTGNPLHPDNNSLVKHAYPLTRSVWVYIRKNGDQSDIDSFVRFILSPEGQSLVGPPEELLPLTPELQQKQLEELTRPARKASGAEEN
jgi:phosphate transport system substrate-binding protein